MNHPPIVNEVKEYVTKFLEENASKKIVYHTRQHTDQVVEMARQMCGHYQLHGNDLLITLVAAQFVDTGYYTDFQQHEAASAQLAENFLKGAGLTDELTKEVKNCLLATRMPQSPENLPQQIVCDAALYHLAAPDFAEQNKLIRKELFLVQGKRVDKNTWRKQTILFLEEHHYFTDYARKNFSKRKKENLQKLKKKDAEAELPIDAASTMLQGSPAEPTAKAERKKEDRPERTIETMFRITSDKSQKLSDQADTKSNILISVNTLILAGVISVLVPKLMNEVFKHYIFPVILLLTVSLLTVIFAILATRPRIPKGTFTQTDIDEKKVNLLFFGNFFKMSFEEYYNGMFAVMDDRHFLYLSLLRDIYTQGLRLSQKYRMLTLAYNIFMFGLILSILAFIITSIIHSPVKTMDIIDY